MGETGAAGGSDSSRLAGQQGEGEGGQSSSDIESLPDPVPSLPVNHGEFLYLLN